MNRSKDFNWNKNRAINLKIGFIIALSFTILAFNWTVDDYNNSIVEPEFIGDPEPIKIIRTAQPEKPQSPPPNIKPTEIIKEVKPITFTNDPIIKKVEPNLNSVQANEVPADYMTLKPGPPPPPIPEEEDYDTGVFMVVEEMPRFGDCSDDSMTKAERQKCSDKAFLEYIYKNIYYPAMARENNVEGTVVVEFIIDQKGKVTEAKIIRNIGAGCGKEALRVVKEMPYWTAGMQRGRKVNVKLKLPIKFKLN